MSAPDLDFLHGHHVDVYSFEGCPDCTRLKHWMSHFGMQHSEVDIHAEPEAAEKLERETGKQAVPFLLIDGRVWVRGYHKELPGRFDPKVLLRELREAIG